MSATSKDIEYPKLSREKNIDIKNALEVTRIFHKKLSPLLYEFNTFSKEVDALKKEYEDDQYALELLEYYINKLISKYPDIAQVFKKRSNSSHANSNDKEAVENEEQADAEAIENAIESMDTYLTIVDSIRNNGTTLIMDKEDYELYNYTQELINVILNIPITTFSFKRELPLEVEDGLMILNALSNITSLKKLQFGDECGEQSILSCTEIIKKNPGLTNIGLSICFYCKEWDVLFQAILNHKQFLTITLDIENDVQSSISKSLRNLCESSKNILNLKMWNIELPEDVVQELIVGLQTSYIISLDLSRSHLLDRDIQSLVPMLRQNNSITDLILSGNIIGNEGIKYLAEAFTPNDNGNFGNQSLTSLIMDNISKIWTTPINATSLDKLLSSLENHHALTKLSYIDNGLDSKGACAFAKLLKGKTKLTTLNISNNLIGFEGAKHITDALTINQSLTQLEIEFTVPGALLFDKVLRFNKSLTFLNMINVKREELPIQLIESLTSALSMNRTLHTILLTGYAQYINLSALETILKTNRTLTRVNISNQSPNEPDTKAIYDNCQKRLAENKKIQTTYQWNLQRSAVLISFVRANTKSVIRHSVLPLIPTIMSNL